MAVAYFEHEFTPDRAKVCVTYPFTLRELEEMETDLSEPPSKILHNQETLGGVSIEYIPQDSARLDTSRPDGAGQGRARQDKATSKNQKEVNEDTENYFKRVNVFACPGRTRHGQASQDLTRQDKEENNENV